MQDKGGLKARSSHSPFPKKGNEKEVGNMDRNSKRRGLGFQDTAKRDSKLMHKTIQKKHLVTQNKKPKKKGAKNSKGDDDQEQEEEQISDDEPSKYSMFKKKSEKK